MKRPLLGPSPGLTEPTSAFTFKTLFHEKEEALIVGAFSVIVKSSRTFVASSTALAALHVSRDKTEESRHRCCCCCHNYSQLGHNKIGFFSRVVVEMLFLSHRATARVEAWSHKKCVIFKL